MTHMATDVQSWKEIQDGSPSKIEGVYGKVVYDRFMAERRKNSKETQIARPTGPNTESVSNITGSYL